MTPPDHELFAWAFGSLALGLGILVVRYWLRDKAQPAGADAVTLPAPSNDRQGWREALQAVQDRSDIDSRIRALEQSLQHVPSSTDFAELAGEVNTVKVEFSALADGQRSMRASLYRIEDFLLNGNRK